MNLYNLLKDYNCVFYFLSLIVNIREKPIFKEQSNLSVFDIFLAKI